jgi:hypothetical protein
MPISDMIESFAQFARAQVMHRGDSLTIDALFDEWRILNPPSEDWPAIRASLRDMGAGETGRPFNDFAADFRQKNDLRAAK